MEKWGIRNCKILVRDASIMFMLRYFMEMKCGKGQSGTYVALMLWAAGHLHFKEMTIVVQGTKIKLKTGATYSYDQKCKVPWCDSRHQAGLIWNMINKQLFMSSNVLVEVDSNKIFGVKWYELDNDDTKWSKANDWAE